MLHPGQPAAQRRTRPPVWLGAPLLVACTIAVLPWMSGDAAPIADSSWIEIVRDDDEGMEIVLRAPPLVRKGRKVDVPGFAWGGEPGMPIEFERAALIAVPGSRGATLDIASQETQVHGDVEAPRVASGRDDSAPAADRPQAWTTQVPTAAVRLENGGMVRGRDVVTLRYTPLLFAPQGGATYVHSMRVRVRFADRAMPRADAPADEPLHAAFLNTRTAAGWQLRFETQKPATPAATLLPQRRIRVRIPRTGLYALTYARLQSLIGSEVDNIDPTQFQIFMDTWAPIPLRADSLPASWQPDYALRETAIWVQGEADHSFDTQDSIVFYALGAEDYVDLTGTRSDSLLHAQNPYDRFQVAWLVWGEASGLRLDSVPSSAPGTPPDLVQSSSARLHFEEDLQFDQVDDLWMWDELRTNNPVVVAFDADLAGVVDPAAFLRIGISDGDAFSSGYHAVRVRLNTFEIGEIRWIKENSRPQNHYATIPVTLHQSNDLRLFLVDYSATLDSDPTAFLKFDLTWDRPLVLPTRGSEAGRLRWSRRPAAPDEAYELGGFGTQEPWILDVTDAQQPVRLTEATATGTPGTWRVRYGRGQGIRTHFFAVNAPTLVDPANLSVETLRPLRAPTSVPDMVIVTETSLLQEAQRLAQHRAAHFPAASSLGHVPEVRVVDVADIYENFSGGRVDALAVRNYLKLLYTQPLLPGETSPRLRYVLLFGEATHDPRRLDSGSQPTLVPTVHAWYADPMDAGIAGPQRAPGHLRRWYAVDDWLGEMDTPRAAGLSNMHPLPDLGVGRLTPRSLADAEHLVDKLIAYDTSTDYGAWRTRVVLSADDECKLGACFETDHVNGMESLVPWTPEEWDIAKTYLTEYPAVLNQKPQGRAAFIRSWSEGCALVCYQGHGAPRQLADEVLFLSTDIPALTNGSRLPVFMAFSCTVAEFDAPQLQTMCEDLIASSTGGAIATMGASFETFASPNADYNIEIWQAMFASGATSQVAFGIMHQLAKNASPIFDGFNNEKYVLLGDPAMTLLAPEALVAFTGIDSLQAGRSTRVEGTVHLPGESTALAGFAGFADVEVLGSADDSGYQSSSGVRIAYDLPGPPLYRGKVAVQDGRFGFQFVVPLGAKLGNKARVSSYAYDPSTDRDAKGADNSVRVVTASTPDSSLGAPRITLYFPNNLTKVKPGTPLVAEIRDENGINIQGTTLPSSILLDFDARNQPLNVTAQFRYADGSDSVGTVTVPLPEGLEPGRHQATMIASDNLQNRSTESLDFEVVPVSATLMANVIAFPNPFRDRTYFFLELTDPADVVVRVYTASGREVWRAQQSVDEPQQVSILWEGIDFAHDELANGTYLYRVEAHLRQSSNQSGPVLKHVGKVVIMRE